MDHPYLLILVVPVFYLFRIKIPRSDKYYYTNKHVYTGKYAMITNFLSPVGFKINVKRLPNVEFFTQRAIIPSVSAGLVETGTPLSNYYSTGDRLLYSELDLSFIVDENMDNYHECLQWMESMTSTEDLGQFSKLYNSDDGVTSDVSVTILNSHKNPNIKFNFLNCFPTSLTGVSLDVTAGDVQPPEATMTFRYDRFKFEKLG